MLDVPPSPQASPLPQGAGVPRSFLEAHIDLGPERAPRFIDRLRVIGRVAETGVAGQVQVLGVSLAEQVVDAGADLPVAG